MNLLSQKIVQVLDLLSQKIVQVSFIINSIICTCVEIVVEVSGGVFSNKVQVWCRLAIICFRENVDKCYIKGKILYLRDFIWCFIFFRRTCQATCCFACTSEILHSGFWSLIKLTFIESCITHLVRFGFLM